MTYTPRFFKHPKKPIHSGMGGHAHSLQKGFTLIETFVAITILTLAIIAPMTLAARSLSISYYVRDEITASYLAQEAIETIRNVRDSRSLEGLLNGSAVDPFSDIPSTNGTAFTVDAHVSASNSMQSCSGTCIPVSYNEMFYGYDDGTGGWVPTRFTRSVTAVYVDAAHTDLLLTITVSWQTGGFQTRTVTLHENLYRWVQ